MIDYVNGDEKAGEKLELKATVHVIADAAIAHFGMKASQEFAKTHLGQRIGSFFAKAFEKTSIGCDGALEILNRVSPKYTGILTRLIKQYGSNIAEDVAKIDDLAGINGIEETLNTIDDTVKSAQNLGVSSENIAKMEQQILNASGNGSHFTEPTLSEGGMPKGDYEIINPADEIVNQNAIKLQNNTADLLASKGYDIEMLPNKIDGNGYGVLSTSSPDYLINSYAFDCYSPNVSKPRNVASVVSGKTETQATRIILNLDGYTGGTVDDIATQFLTWNIPTLNELIIIKDGKILRLIIK